MNYYERHLGDYAKDAGHLSMAEHGAYTLLLDRYYATESGIPEDMPYRICRARSAEERAAVDVVLAEFFQLVGGSWRNDRAEEEIEKARVRIVAAQENGKKGGRPLGKKTQWVASGLPVGTQEEPKPNPDKSSPVHQTPSNQTPEDQTPANAPIPEVQASPKRKAADAADRFDAAGFLVQNGVEPQTASDYLTLRKAKRAPATRTAMQDIIREAGKTNWSTQDVITKCCQAGWSGFKAAWVADQHARAGPRLNRDEERKRTLDELTGRTRHGKPQQQNERDITAEVIRIA